MAAARVLVVDDDTLMLDVVSRMLRRGGYEVLPAPGPQQALDLVRRAHPMDVVLADIRMPEMSGTQLVREMADLSPRTARLLMTAGVSDPADVPEGVPVLRKPFRSRELLAAVEAALTRSAQLSVALQLQREQAAQLQQQSQKLCSEAALAREKSAQLRQQIKELRSEFRSPSEES